MKKTFAILLSSLLCISSFAQQKQSITLSAEKTNFEVLNIKPESFNVRSSIKDLNYTEEKSENGDFTLIYFDGAITSNNIGKANLPVISKLIEVPYDAEIKVTINNYTEEVVYLSDYDLNVIKPSQPSYSKSTSKEDMKFVIDKNYYETDEYDNIPIVKTEVNGIMRGTRLGRIEIRPYHYNPVENSLIIYNNLDIQVDFVNADISKTMDMKAKYQSNVFNSLQTKIINTNYSQAKDELSNYSKPIKYVIVANSFFEEDLQEFVNWKTRQGFNIIEHYVETGTSNTEIKTYLEDLYTSATPDDPAPLYVLIIGDHDGAYSIPAFDSRNGYYFNDHVTDLYFATYDGNNDIYPDLYMGRISCNSSSDLQNALNKTLAYEQYTMPNTDYLNNALLIAGVDSYWGPRTGDASLWYFAEHYINTEHGFENIYAYYQNQPNAPYFAGDSDSHGIADDIIDNITSGVGFANYTAHCLQQEWGDPQIHVRDIPNLNNQDKYPFMIGNCCLSYKLDYNDSFGEELLQAENNGAVVYIGASNNSYWNEDFWWGVGTSSLDHTITENVGEFTTTNTENGIYDMLFHENGQTFDEWYYTASQIVYAGNLVVESTTSDLKQYYWEIYFCSGDPSLIPYMSKPEELTLSFNIPNEGDNTLAVTTEPHTYVALSKNGELIDAKWSGESTSVELELSNPFLNEAYCLVATKQDRVPYINESLNPYATSIHNNKYNTLNVYPNPASNKINIRGVVASEINIIDISGRTIKSIVNSQEINISDIDNGIYLIKLIDINGGIHISKLIKE